MILDDLENGTPQQLVISCPTINDLPETALISMTNILGGTAYNDLIIDFANQKVYYKEFLKSYTITGDEAWSAASEQMPGKNFIIHPIIADVNEQSEYFPFFGMSHYKHDWAGDFGDGVTQGWDIWGRKTDLDPNAWLLYIYNYGFDTPNDFMNYAKTLANSATPMKFYYITYPKNIDITNTALGQSLL